MKIYQDLEEAIAKGTTGKFIRDAVREHQGSNGSETPPVSFAGGSAGNPEKESGR